MFAKIFNFIKKRPVVSVLIVLVIGSGLYYWRQKQSASAVTTQYVTAAAERGTLTVTVDGTGQVAASNQIDLKTEASGKILKLQVQPGQTVKAGQVLLQLDATDALKSVRDANMNLKSAQLSLQKLEQPADQLTLTQAQNALAAAEQAKSDAITTLAKAYDDGYTSVTNAYLDLPAIMAGMQDMLYGNTISPTQTNINYYADSINSYDSQALTYRDQSDRAFQAARTAYEKSFVSYKSTSSISDDATIEATIAETYKTAKDILDAAKAVNNLIQLYKDRLAERRITPNSLAETHIAALNSYTTKLNTHVSSLFAATSNIRNDKQNITDADRTITEKTQSLQKIRAGTDRLDLQSSQLSVQQRQAALADAQSNLAHYTVRAPVDAMVAAVPVKLHDNVGNGVTAATLISAQQMATISLNEVDVAKVHVGQKVNLTFDALQDLAMTGTVTQIDTLGTVSQGVVSYSVNIAFDTQDERIRPGMSVSASIITEVHPDVLMVPGAAVKTQGNRSTVQVLVNGTPEERMVTAGVSNDTMIEVSGDIAEGENVVTQTITGSSSAAGSRTTGNVSIFGALGGGGANRTFGGATGAMRVQTIGR